jgi:serine/threonine protein kinase/formylglycine-generating enzyme required for sulfatase activity
MPPASVPAHAGPALPPEGVPPAFEEYRLIHLLGRGAMGEVYLAHDTLLERPVAIKFISRERNWLSPVRREWFRREARAIARVQHPNVVSVFRTGEVSGRLFLVSEYLRGQSLDGLTLPLSWQRALELSVELARGLAATHRQGVLHRDLKPANVFLTEDGTVKLLDFGLAQLSSADEAPGAGSEEVPAPSLAILPPPSESGLLGEATPAASHGLLPVRQAARPPSGEHRPLPARPVVGTPRYMAPELWRGQPATPASDVYAFGALAFELCTGSTPFAHLPGELLPERIQLEDAPALSERAPGVDLRFAALVQRCLSVDPRLRFESGDALLEALERLAPSRRAWALPEGNPYRGLRPFEAEHQGVYFGRSAEVSRLCERVRSEPFVLVAGDSGVGKSSLCRAGLLPALASGAWGPLAPVRLTLSPGPRPVSALAAVLAPVLDVAETAVAEALRHAPAEVGRWLRQRHGRAGLVLLVDPLEELVTLAAPAEADAAARALAALCLETPGLRLVATVRSDLLARVATLPALGEAMGRALTWLRPLSSGALREVIVGPAEAKGVHFESASMVDQLVESSREGGALPLLQFALAELWEARPADERVLQARTLAAQSGVEGCLARHADSVLEGMPPSHREAARDILLGLVTAEGTRSRRSGLELTRGRASFQRALEVLVHGRLVVARGTAGTALEEDSYELAHEALVSHWATLRDWLHGNGRRRALQERIQRAAREWERLGRAAEALLGETQWKEVSEEQGLVWGALEAQFLRASQRALRRRRAQRLLLTWGLPAAIAVALLAVGKGRYDRLQSQRVHREVAQKALVDAEATAQASRAARREAHTLFDAHQSADGEARWLAALEASRQAEVAYRQAESAFERALQADPSSEELHRGLARLLADRIASAREHAPHASVETLWTRLAAHDLGGEERRRLEAPARVSIETVPPGAQVHIERQVLIDGRYQARVEDAERPVPLLDAEVKPGSVVFVLRRPGHVEVRLPMVLEAGQRYALRVALPAAADAPKDFIYIPPGTFLQGSADDEGLRRFFLGAPPIHARRTGAYWIGRHEVTFGEWLDFLEALPPDERARRTPGSNGLIRQNTLGLTRLGPQRWKLSLQVTQHRYEAVSGTPFRYRGRERRVEQDWLRFPVSSISFADAQAYVAWLSATGRVPGARLCSDVEWERAARGADGRSFPASEELSADDANHDVTYGRVAEAFGPDMVGSHPGSRSPFGLEDTAGNVWELTHEAGTPSRPIMRGGSSYHEQLSSRLNNREASEPSQRDVLLGLRVCATPRPNLQ